MCRSFLLLFAGCLLLVVNPAFAAGDADTLYRQAYDLECENQLADALTLYNRVITDFAGNSFAGPDKASFRSKVVACRIALATGDITEARRIADDIKALPSSVQQKPEQLFSAGYYLFEQNDLFADAISFYDLVLANFPDSAAAGPDKAGFHKKYH